MNVSRTSKLAGLAVVGALALTACGSDDTKDSTSSGTIDCATGDLKGAGATFQKNIQDAWIKKYLAACSGATIDYASVGSGAGISQFGEGTVDYAGSDSTMKDEEQAKADARCGSPALHLPVAGGGVSVAYKLDGVDNVQLSPATVAGIFQGTIKKWDDATIKADNPGATLPSTSITAIHREDSSGTTSIFSKYLNKAATGVWKLDEGKELDWPTTVQGAKGSDGVTAAAAAVNGGVTYTELSYVTAAGLKSAKIKNAAGEYLAPDADTVSTALAGAEVPASGDDLKVKIDFLANTAGAYPITGVTYVIACSKGKDATKTALLKSYLTYAVGEGQEEAEPNDYAPLPGSLATRVKAVVATLS